MPKQPSTVNITKKKFNVYLDEAVVKEAHDLCLNISKICENALILYIEALKKSGVTSPQ
jgi:post-segregation antitoxin (ccd killing protein)